MKYAGVNTEIPGDRQSLLGVYMDQHGLNYSGISGMKNWTCLIFPPEAHGGPDNAGNKHEVYMVLPGVILRDAPASETAMCEGGLSCAYFINTNQSIDTYC